MKKRLVSALCAMAMTVTLMLPATVMAADDAMWDKVPLKQEWTYTDELGTNIKAAYDEDSNTLYIQGNGAVPSYSKYALGNRPWNDKNVFYIVIESGITSIGAEAFSGLKELRKVTMYVNTFIEDPSAFKGAYQDCIFDFEGMNIVSRDFANVPFDSLDSIALFMERYNLTYRYQLENYYMTSLLQSRVNPKVKNLVPEDAILRVYNPDYPIVDYTSTLTMVSTKPDYTMSTEICVDAQGKLALQVISDVLDIPGFSEYEYGKIYNMSVNSVRGIYKTTDTELTYCMTIPAALQKPGRQFKLLQLGEGAVNLLDDLDMDDNTLTFKTAQATGAIVLVYKD